MGFFNLKAMDFSKHRHIVEVPKNDYENLKEIFENHPRKLFQIAEAFSMFITSSEMLYKDFIFFAEANGFDLNIETVPGYGYKLIIPERRKK